MSARPRQVARSKRTPVYGGICVGDIVRVVHPVYSHTSSVVLRITPTLIVLRDGRRFSRKTGLLYGVGATSTKVERYRREAHHVARAQGDSP